MDLRFCSERIIGLLIGLLGKFFHLSLCLSELAVSLTVHPTSRNKLDDFCAPLGCHAAYDGKSWPMFRDILSVPSSRAKKSWDFLVLTMEPRRFPETSVESHHRELCDIQEQHRLRLLREGILKSGGIWPILTPYTVRVYSYYASSFRSIIIPSEWSVFTLSAVFIHLP